MTNTTDELQAKSVPPQKNLVKLVKRKWVRLRSKCGRSISEKGNLSLTGSPDPEIDPPPYSEVEAEAATTEI